MNRIKLPSIDEYEDRKPSSYPTLFWLFMTGSLLGFLMEGIWHLLRTGKWARRVATLWGPFCIIYGAGAVVMYLLALRIGNKGLLLQFMTFAMAGSAVEYLAGVFQETVFGTVSWDYSSHALNISGRISLKMTLVWGLAGLMLTHLLLPVILSLLTKLHLNRLNAVCLVMSVLMAINLLLTGCALLRWESRTAGQPARNAVEHAIDHCWDDAWMQERFPNMRFTGPDTDQKSLPWGRFSICGGNKYARSAVSAVNPR